MDKPENLHKFGKHGYLRSRRGVVMPELPVAAVAYSGVRRIAAAM